MRKLPFTIIALPAASPLFIAGCRSQKTSDSETSASTHYVAVNANVANHLESADSAASDSRIVFLPEGGEICITPCGEIALKAVASARIAQTAKRTESCELALTSRSESLSDSIAARASEIPTQSSASPNSSTFAMIFLLAVAAIIIFKPLWRK